jgi:diaminohydroxyphosphoribosylaminopyrimidine deaminase/5-amino-6-(5-phosphoribosylamino)uracil reductase
VIIDGKLKVPLSSPCISGSAILPTVIACTKADKDKAASLKRKGVQILLFKSSDGRVPLGKLFRELGRRYGAMSVLIEGGGEILAGALSEKLIDRFVWVIAPMIIGGRDAVSSIGGRGISELGQAIKLKDVSVSRIGKDILVEADILYPHPKGKR